MDSNLEKKSLGWSQKSAGCNNQHRVLPTNGKVCAYWAAGRCNRNPCRFLHGEPIHGNTYHRLANKSPYQYTKSPHLSIGTSVPTGERDCLSTDHPHSKPEARVCPYWLEDKCRRGDKCSLLHSLFQGDDFTMLAALRGHKKVVSGVVLPPGSNKLYSTSTDGTVRIWDCHTGQCAQFINMGAEVRCLANDGPLLFLGVTNVVKVWNVETGAKYDLRGLHGQVYALQAVYNRLFAGVQDGSIWVWRWGTEDDPFRLVATLKGHTSTVVTLVVGCNRLFSGSTDQTIRVWDLDTLQCVQTLDGHADAVASLLCFDRYLLSCSRDRTIKVWVSTEGGGLEVVYTHSVYHGILALAGMNDLQARPVLLCACTDCIVRLYELPSFTERGRLFSRREVRMIQVASGGLFFTGDAVGMLTVWRWLEPSRNENIQTSQMEKQLMSSAPPLSVS